jgi:hypothetical protein
MRSAALFLSLFGITAASSAFYHKLTNDFTQYTDGEVYAGTGKGYGGTTCDNRLLLDMTKYLDHPYVRDQLCVNKCAVNPKSPGCKHFVSDEYADDPGGIKGGQERSCMMRKQDKGWYQDSKPVRGGNMDRARDDISMEWDYMCGRVDDERNVIDNANRRRSGLVPDDQLIGGGREYVTYSPYALNFERGDPDWDTLQYGPRNPTYPYGQPGLDTAHGRGIEFLDDFYTFPEPWDYDRPITEQLQEAQAGTWNAKGYGGSLAGQVMTRAIRRITLILSLRSIIYPKPGLESYYAGLWKSSRRSAITSRIVQLSP